MIDIELFYKTVEAKIRKNHTEYLEKEKRAVVPVKLPVVAELPTGEEWKKLSIFAKIKLKKQRKEQLKALKKAKKKQQEIRVEDKLLKGYNAGVKQALNVLSAEFKAYVARFKKEEKTGKRH